MDKKSARITICIAVAIIIVITFFILRGVISKKEAEQRYQQIHSIFSSCVPVEEQNYLNICFYQGEENDYLYLKANNKVILGMRDRDSGEVYYFTDGLCFDQDGDIQETNVPNNHIFAQINSAFTMYLTDEDATYAFHTPSGRDLPLGVGPLDTGYYLVSRRERNECVEAICYRTDDNNPYIRWIVTQMNGDVTFYAVVTEENGAGTDRIPGWGSVPQSIGG